MTEGEMIEKWLREEVGLAFDPDEHNKMQWGSPEPFHRYMTWTAPIADFRENPKLYIRLAHSGKLELTPDELTRFDRIAVSDAFDGVDPEDVCWFVDVLLFLRKLERIIKS